MCRIRTIMLLLFMILLPFKVFANVSVNQVLCENKINPMGVNLKEIAFSWEIYSTGFDVAQIAYHRVVASSKDKLNADDYDVYNTDLVKSLQSIRTMYNGKELQPGTSYYWKVRIWDNQNRISAWSDVQTFPIRLCKSIVVIQDKKPSSVAGLLSFLIFW